jgi:hypothetical protein
VDSLHSLVVSTFFSSRGVLLRYRYFLDVLVEIKRETSDRPQKMGPSNESTLFIKRETSDRPQKMGPSNESTSCLSLDETTRKCTIDMLIDIH